MVCQNRLAVSLFADIDISHRFVAFQLMARRGGTRTPRILQALDSSVVPIWPTLKSTMLTSTGGRSGNRSHGKSTTMTRTIRFHQLRPDEAFYRNMAISGTNFTIKNTIIDAFTSGGFPFNTDGFDIK